MNPRRLRRVRYIGGGVFVEWRGTDIELAQTDGYEGNVVSRIVLAPEQYTGRDAHGGLHPDPRGRIERYGGRQAMTTPLRFSHLALMGKSPAHFKAHVEQDTAAMRTGTVADALIFGHAPVVVYPGKVRNGKEWDKWRDAHDPTAHIVLQSEYDKADGIAQAVCANREAMELLDGRRQATYLWDFDGIQCRGTPDVAGQRGARRHLCELKTGETSDPRYFPFKVRRFSYHAALAWYEAGHALAGLGTIHDSYIVAVEQSPPHVVTIYHMAPDLIESGARLWRLWFEQLKGCLASDAWPGYSQSIIELEIPDNEIEIGDAG